MKFTHQLFSRVTAGALAVVFAVTTLVAPRAFAEEDSSNTTGNTSSFSMSPMYEKIVLDPGESYTSSFRIRATNTATQPFFYKVYNQPYYRSEDNQVVFEEHSNMSQIMNWTTINSPMNGSLEPGEATDISFTINVPKDAPAGGQYMTITVGSDSKPVSENGGINIQESIAMGYTVYAEITGTTVRQGEISGLNVPSFLLSGDITASSTIKNTGNVHGSAKYVMQVFPLFSSEEVFTNEENPDTLLILPDRTLYHETIWENTPSMGIFNVVYTVEFEGVTSQVKKLVIKCPIWFLFIIIFGIIVLITWCILRFRARRTTKRRPATNTSSDEA